MTSASLISIGRIKQARNPHGAYSKLDILQVICNTNAKIFFSNRNFVQHSLKTRAAEPAEIGI